MGIIISSFPGCGKEYLMNTHGGKAKMIDAVNEYGHIGQPTGDDGEYDYDLFVDAVMNDIGKYDIVFIPIGDEYLNTFNERNIDYDIFYPSKERRGEFIENFVRKRMKPAGIRILDRDFDKMVDKIDNIEAENCYKHQLKGQGQFIGNDPSIMSYINSLENDKRS
jgi:hypothetical protein